MDVVDVQRVSFDVHVRPLEAALLARLPRQVVFGVMNDREPAENGVAELVPAPLAGGRHHPTPSPGRRRSPRCGRCRAARPDHFLQRDDIGADVAQHGGDSLGPRAPIHPDDRWML